MRARVLDPWAPFPSQLKYSSRSRGQGRTSSRLQLSHFSTIAATNRASSLAWGLETQRDHVCFCSPRPGGSAALAARDTPSHTSGPPPIPFSTLRILPLCPPPTLWAGCRCRRSLFTPHTILSPEVYSSREIPLLPTPTVADLTLSSFKSSWL